MDADTAQPTMRKKLTRSLEDYLEAILVLVRQHRVARVRDIARRLHVGMPSVTAALKTLTRRKLVNYDPYQVVTLTDLGREQAEAVSMRHETLRRFLTDVLGLDADAADENACRMEHAIDQAVLDRLRQFSDFAESCGRADPRWLERFERFRSDHRGANRPGKASAPPSGGEEGTQ